MRSTISAGLLLLVVLLAGCGGGGGGNNSSSSSSGSTSGTDTGTGVTGTGGPLNITNTSLPVGLTGKPYAATITTTGGTGRLTFSVTPGSFFPHGLAMDASTGAISGSVSGAVFGDVTFQVMDSGNPRQVAIKTIRMTMNWSLTLVSGTNPIPDGHTNVPYETVYYASSANGNVGWSVSAGQLPSGLSLNKISETEVHLRGTPTQAGTYNFTLQVVDSSSPPQTATLASTVVVDSKLAISTLTVPVPYVNEAYSQTLSAVNGTPPYHWTGQLPSFLTVDANTGTLTGTGSQGNYWASITVTDSGSPAQTATQTYTMLVLPRLSVNSSMLIDAHLDGSYNTNLPYLGGQGNLAWTITSGTLPPGLSLQSRYGIVSGIPRQTGAYPFSVELQDSSTPPQVAQGQFTINVKSAVLALQGSLPRRIPINVPFEDSAVATGGTAPVTWSLNGGTLPTGLGVDGPTGRVSGTPTTSGYYMFTLRAVDSSTPPQNSTYTYDMTVGPALGRNDIPSKATPIANGGYQASISPLLDPPTGEILSPDTDYYRITGIAGATLTVTANAYSPSGNSLLDPVLELVDANGVRLNNCRLPGDVSSTFASACINDDADGVSLNSKLEYRVQGTGAQTTDIYAHVLDWRGDARPDMSYSIGVNGAFVPIVWQTDGTLPDVAANSGYYLSIHANGGSGRMTGTITEGQLPPGITMSGNDSSFLNNDGTSSWFALLAGSPTTPGTYTFTMTVTDEAVPPQKTSRQFTIHVFPPIQLSTIPDQVLTAGQNTSYQAIVNGGIAPFHWSLIGWPEAKIDQNSGLITFQPTVPGQFSIDVWVSGTGLASGGTQWVHQIVNVTVNP